MTNSIPGTMEDSHYFLGLESYIDHETLPRVDMDNLDYTPLPPPKIKMEESDKSEKGDGCGKREDVGDAGRTSANVQADDFFSSLELQSSSKTSSNVISLSFSNKSSSGIVTRSRSFSSTFHEVPKSSEKIPSKSSKTKGRPKKEAQRKKSERLPTRRKVRTKGKNRKVQGSKKTSPDGKEKSSTSADSKRPNSVKSEEYVLERSLTLEKSKEEDDWILFNSLGSRKEMDDKMFENKQILGNDLPNSGRRCTPELFSIKSILMSDTMSEGRDDVVDKFLDEMTDCDGFLDEVLNYGPPRSHTGGKWKPGCLSIRTSPMLWQSQNWDALLEDRHQEEERKNGAETPVDSPTESSPKLSSIPSSGGKWKSFAPPATYTGGKWKPLTPPPTYTGGKWKPSDLPQRPKKSDQDSPSLEEGDHGWKCEGERGMEPPVGHTGGKWKPNSSHGTDQWKPDPSKPPSGHTRGKWVSVFEKGTVSRSPLDVLANCQSTSGKCLKTSGGMIQYYCSPCNRRLSSKKMYKKHVQSELHFKRVLQENELEFDSRSLKLFHGLFTQTGHRERGLGKRVIKKPEMFKNDDAGSVKKERKIPPLTKAKGKRVTRREMIRCEICKIKLPSHQLGKHLVSYYHSRRIRLQDPDQQKLILENIHAIVKQAPYQCGICKFYCNTHSFFKKHWSLDVHRQQEQSADRRFWCALCSFECETSRSMELHLDSNSHREVILAVNKSIPIIIRHKIIFSCPLCCKGFRFRRELIRHKEIFHRLKEGETNTKFVCSLCEQNYKNMKSLQKHILFSHAGSTKVPYFCTCCNEFFDSAEEAKTHRNGQLHKYRKITSEGENPGKKTLSRTCSYCRKTLENVARLKTHLRENHPEFLPKCLKCGRVFALSQEVSRHVRNKECDFSETTTRTSSSEAFACDRCPFRSASKSESLLHAAIHQKKESGEKKISCPLCGSLFTQTALSIHLKTHLKEMTYQCSQCSRAFVRKDRYLAHLRSKHFLKSNDDSSPAEEVAEAAKTTGTEEKRGEGEKETEEEEATPTTETQEETEFEKKKLEKRQVCGDAKCKYVAKDLDDLENHSLFHIGPKIYQCPECPYYAKTNTIIKRHYLKHIDERSFPCPHCSFRGRLKSHLKRHMRLHTGAKPYKCPHCPYTCNILENLRKHVLFTKIHPGKKLYECKLCDFDTNVSKDFKLHLFKNHKSECKSTEANVVAGIYNREEDFSDSGRPLPGRPRPRQQTPNKSISSTLKRKIEEVSQKFSPIAPKMISNDKKPATPSLNLKNSGNSVEDKRKILKMELEKLRKQIQPGEKKLPRSYPSPAEKDLRMKMWASQEGQGGKKASPKRDGLTEGVEEGIVLLNATEEILPKTAESDDVTRQQQQTTFSPAYILYENVLPSEEMELYLLEDYQG